MKLSSVILFDLDGTLIDSTEAILESFFVAYEKFGDRPPAREAIAALIGEPLPRMFSKLGDLRAPVEEYVTAYKAHYCRISRQKTRLLPGAREAIDRAASFARLGVVTTKTGRYSVELLEHFGVMDRFDVLVGSEDVSRHKPHPEPVRKALAKMGYEEGPVWMIGDTPMDVEAALAAGVEPFAVSCGYAPVEALEKGTSNIASDALNAVLEIEKRQSLL